MNGVKLWIHLGPITFQPVEIAKLLLVIFFASYFVEKREMLSLSTRRVGNRLMPDVRPLAPIAVAWVVSVMVILFEHDIGFSLLLVRHVHHHALGGYRGAGPTWSAGSSPSWRAPSSPPTSPLPGPSSTSA